MTNQENSGQINLEEQLDNLLNEYASQVPNIFTGDVNEYLGMSRDELDSLSKEDRYTASLRLAQFAIYVQRLANREKARVSWSNAILHKLAANRWDDYDSYTKGEIKMYKIAAENPTMQKAIKIKNHAIVRIDELDNISLLIKHFSDMMMRSSYVS